MKLVGPAQTIDPAQFNLAPDPPEFEKLLSGRDATLGDIDQTLLLHGNDVYNGGPSIASDLDGIAGELAAAQSEADTIGVLEEIGIISDLSSAVADLDAGSVFE